MLPDQGRSSGECLHQRQVVPNVLSRIFHWLEYYVSLQVDDWRSWVRREFLIYQDSKQLFVHRVILTVAPRGGQ